MFQEVRNNIGSELFRKDDEKFIQLRIVDYKIDDEKHLPICFNPDVRPKGL
jgi:hypothetical protein